MINSLAEKSEPNYTRYNVIPQTAVGAGQYIREPLLPDKQALHMNINMMGWKVALADIVGWRIGANKKYKVNRVVGNITGDYPTKQDLSMLVQ